MVANRNIRGGLLMPPHRARIASTSTPSPPTLAHHDRAHPMSGIASDLARVERAFAKPTLSLLARKNAAVVVAVFSQVFSQERSAVAADRFHALIETLLNELRAAGAAEGIDE